MSELLDEVKAAAALLKEAGLPSPRADAEELAAHVAKVDRSRLHTITEWDAAAFRRLVERRADRVPLQHLTGRAYFRNIVVQVGPGVFVPRPETEVVAGWAIDALSAVKAPTVVDLCSGSGVLALSIADEVSGSKVHAVELDQRAVAWLERNARGTRVLVHRADAAVALPQLDGKVHAVVSNPPYVALEELDQVEAEVRDHDPRQALVAGVDGLDVIRVVERRARRLLRRGGLLVIEHSDRQGASVPALLAAAGSWTEIADHKDLTGRDRFTTAVWAG